MLRGDWGFSFISRVDVDKLIWQRVPITLAVIGASQMLALAIALPVGIYVGDAALFLVRPASPARWPSSASRCRPSSPACC